MDFDLKLFKVNGKDFTYEELMKRIYQKSESRDEQIEKVVKHITEIIKNSGDAIVLAPTIAKYIETSVANDGNLIKLASIISTLMKNKKTNASGEDEYMLTDAMKKELMLEAEQILKKH
jgi:RNA polymerase-interacting CarD/CdnL/TRCF family regulator